MAYQSGKPPTSFWVGLICGLLPFVVSFSSLSTSSGPGGSTCSYTDFAGIILGIVAGIAGFGVLSARQWQPGLRYGAGALIIALGVFQLVRGIGLVGGPCN